MPVSPDKGLGMQEVVPEASRVRFTDVKGCKETVAEVRYQLNRRHFT